MKSKGCFISLEGIDASGKTTLVAHLREYLNSKGFPLISIREPGGTFISEKIRQLLLDVSNEGIRPWTEAILYGAARKQLVEEIILPSLNKGEIVLADRYLDSTLAYQGHGRGLDINLLSQLNLICTGGVQPDLTLLLDISAEEAQKRRPFELADRLEKEGLDFQSRVRGGYLELAALYPKRIKMINASLQRPEVTEQAIHFMEEFLQQRYGK